MPLARRRNRIPIHKFITRYRRPEERPVTYRPHTDVVYQAIPRAGKIEVFAQQTINIEPNSLKRIILKIGLTIRRGIVLISLKQDLKLKKCSLADSVVAETVDDIIITIHNYSSEIVTINAGDTLCYISSL